MSLNPDRSSAVRLDRSTVKGEIYVFVRNSRTSTRSTSIWTARKRTKPPVRTDAEPHRSISRVPLRRHGTSVRHQGTRRWIAQHQSRTDVVGRHHLEPPCALQGREHRRNPDTHRRADRNGHRADAGTTTTTAPTPTTTTTAPTPTTTAPTDQRRRSLRRQQRHRQSRVGRGRARLLQRSAAMRPC